MQKKKDLIFWHLENGRDVIRKWGHEVEEIIHVMNGASPTRSHYLSTDRHTHEAWGGIPSSVHWQFQWSQISKKYKYINKKKINLINKINFKHTQYKIKKKKWIWILLSWGIYVYDHLRSNNQSNKWDSLLATCSMTANDLQKCL